MSFHHIDPIHYMGRDTTNTFTVSASTNWSDFCLFPNEWKVQTRTTQEAEHVQSNADGFMFAESGLRKLNQSDWVIGKLVENNLCSISSVYHSYKCDYCPWGMLEFELIYLVFVYLCICVFVYLCICVFDICVFVYMCICVFVYMCICTCTV